MQKQNIIQTVQYNCDIADSQAANDYTLCVYLLKMREYYRWENNLEFNEDLPNNEVGNWINQREQQWNKLDDADFKPIKINNKVFAPFDTAEINQELEPIGLIYSGGLNQQHHPHFFIAELQDHHVIDNYHVYISNTELARELTAPPAMSHNKTIFIRKQSLKRMIWERLEEWRWKKGKGAMSQALSFYNFDNQLERSLEQMTEHETEVMLHHEIGEIEAGKHLGESWHTMLASLPRSKANFMARAVRDNLADCSSTLPMLIQKEKHASLHFYFGNFNAMRKEIFPSLFSAYQHWQTSGDDKLLLKQINVGEQHWSNIAHEILNLHNNNPENSLQTICNLVDQNKL